MKTCRHCGKSKAASEFPSNPRVSDGLSSWCRACHSEATERWRAANPERIALYNARRRANPWQRYCIDCRRYFASVHTVRCESCRHKRKRERDKMRHASKAAA
jgi:hypothetical protein